MQHKIPFLFCIFSYAKTQKNGNDDFLNGFAVFSGLPRPFHGLVMTVASASISPASNVYKILENIYTNAPILKLPVRHAINSVVFINKMIKITSN